MSGLSLVSSRRDLPPKWDGRRVEWSEWANLTTTYRLHAPAKHLRCRACGSMGEPLHATGTVYPNPGENVTGLHTRRLPSGRTYERQETRPATPLRHLSVARCPDCGLDTVFDLSTNECWDLEDSDYGEDGSYSDADLQPGLF